MTRRRGERRLPAILRKAGQSDFLSAGLAVLLTHQTNLKKNLQTQRHSSL